MQSLIHGNFEGAAQKQVVCAGRRSGAIAAAVGPLLGGFITTYLSWRVGFLLEVVIIAVVLSGIKMVQDVPYTGSREVDVVGGVLSVAGHGWHRARHPGLAGGRRSRAGDLVGRRRCAPGFAWWLIRRKRQRQAALIDPDLFQSKHFPAGNLRQMLQQIALGGAMIALPIYLQMVLEYNAMQAGLSLAPLSLSMFAVAMLAGRRAGQGDLHASSAWALCCSPLGMVILIPIVPRADSGWYFLIPW